MSTNPCPLCDNELVYDHFTDSMKCLFCSYRHSIAAPYNITDDETDGMKYADDDNVGYGDYMEDW